MLILKRVEIQGFKSFCDRTEMRFQGKGIAAIVGPNGCGKSNLSDAISWVLGEQSAKSLRGSRMEDVIFAGTRDRKPIGMAQVTMVLVDPTGSTVIPGARPEAPKPARGAKAAADPAPLPAAETPAEAAAPAAVPAGDANAANGSNGTNGASGAPNGFSLHSPGKEQEITITRRLFRSGDSEYLINGRPARLRDIQELFMGTGLGPESYAIIEQGRIGQILSSKPLDRRAVIEEACGISKFKNKRRLAEAKLEGAKQNLTRVFDILEEVSRQVNSLKRQAGKAKRYEELKSDLDTQLRVALTGRYLLLEREAVRVGRDLAEASRLYQQLHASVSQEELSLAAARESFYQLEADLTETRKRLSEVRVEAERTRGQIESQARQIGSIDQRLQQGETETEDLARRLETLEQERTHLAAQLEELQQLSADARQRLAAKNEEKDVLQNQLRERERNLEQARQQVVRLLGEASSLKNQLAQIDSLLAAIERDTARVRRDEETAQADIERLEAARADLAQRLAARQGELEAVQERRAQVDEDLHSRRASAQDTRRQLDALKTETSRLRARRDSLEEILSHRAYTTESVKRLFTAVERGHADSFKPAGVLADFVDLTHPEFEKATEEFLHEELEYVVVKSWDEARRGIDVLRGDLDGRATFLVEPHLNSDSNPVVSSPVPEPAIGPETGIVGRLSDAVRFSNGLTNAPAALLPRLARCFLAESRDAAQRLSTVYPDLFFLLSDGVCYYGHAVSGGKKTGTGPLALKRELREISGLFQDRQHALNQAQSSLDQLEAEIQSLSEALEQLRAEQQRQEKDTLLIDQEMRKVSEEFNRAGQRLNVARADLDRFTRDAARHTEERERKALLVEEKDQQRAEVERSLEEQRAGLEDLRQNLSVLAEEHSVLRVELAGFEERRRGVESAAQRLENQIRDVTTRRLALASELERLALSRNRLLEHNLELEERGASLAGQQETLEQGVARLAEAEAAQRAALAASEENIKATRAAAAEAQEKRSQIELELVRRQSELKFLDETCRKDLNIPVAELAAARTATANEESGSPDTLAVSAFLQAHHPAALDLDDEALSALIAQALAARPLLAHLEAQGLFAAEEFDALACAEAVAAFLRAGEPVPEDVDDLSLAVAEALAASPESREQAVCQALNLPPAAERVAAVLQALRSVGQASRPAAGLQAGPEAPPPPLDEFAVAEAEEKVSELRRRIEALGPVNPEALAEYQEAQQRYDFLNTQRQDLLDSIRDTEKAIHEIDTESRKRFTEAFAVINENFKQMFRTLFGGGIGEMRLTGEGDALEQGIEIVASPPGKRLQNVLLLSGGEKALTAISLLMAIFQYQPSPFCILDEVDAPLDEANVGRLSNLLRDMASQTQFIVITHAKKTMEAAEMLYGVTMQEQGVSKLVSVRLQSAPPPPQPSFQTAARA